MVPSNNQDQCSYLEGEFLSNFFSFRIGTVLLNPPDSLEKGVYKRDFGGFQWKFMTFLRLKKSPRIGEMLSRRRESRREDDE